MTPPTGSTPDGPDRRPGDRPGDSAAPARKNKGRATVLSAIVGAIAIVFLVIITVSQCAPGDPDGQGDSSGPTTSVVERPASGQAP